MDINKIINKQNKNNEDNKTIDIRLIKRNARKSITLIENLSIISLDADFIKKMAKDLKIKFGCGATIREKNILELQGDHRNIVKIYIINEYKIDTNNIKIHGT